MKAWRRGVRRLPPTIGAAAAALLVLHASTPPRLRAQASRVWRPDDRAFVTDLSRVTAVAATQTVVYAATPNGLAVYDAGFRTWRETVGPMDGYPAGLVTTMTADPSDDTAWLGGRGFWASWHAFGRRWESGTLPGVAEVVVLDARDPSRGAFFRVGGRWHVVSRMGGLAMPAGDVPPPGRRHGPLSADDVRRRMPAFEAVRLRIERDEFLRSWPITAVAATPVGGDLFVATDGNGLFRLDAVTGQVERLPAGLLGSAVGTVAARGGTICAGGEDRLGTRRRAITCFDEELRRFEYFERGAGLASLPGAEVRDLAVADRAIWVATEQGLLRVDRRERRIPLRHLHGDDLPSDDVGALLERAGGVWAGTTAGLVWIADTARGRADPTDVSVAVSGIALRRDTLWLATSFGIVARAAAADAEAASGRVRVEGRPMEEAVAAVGAGDAGVLAAAANRLLWIAGDSAVWLPAPPLAVGEVRAIGGDGDGFWVAGARGIGFLRPASGQWLAFIAPGDLPGMVTDLLPTGRWLWVATERGVLRFDKRAVLR